MKLYKKNQNLFRKNFTCIFVCLFGLLMLGTQTGICQASPTITQPENFSRFTTGDSCPIIMWTPVLDADDYEIEFSLNPEFDSPFSLFSDNTELDFGLDQTTWDSLSLQLFFHVRALKNDNPYSEWSDTIEFAKTLQGKTSILSPADDTRFAPGKSLPVLQWEPIPSITNYTIEFSFDELFQNSMGQFILPDTKIDCNISGDPEIWDLVSGTFYWRVWGLEGKFQIPTPCSDVFVFSKTTEQPPALISPTNKTLFSGSSTMPTFTWEALPHNPDEYHIQFAYGSSQFAAGGGYIEVLNPSFTFDSVGITQEMWDQFFGKLKWRVAGNDSQGNHGAFSNAFYLVKISNNNYMAYGDSITGGYGASDWDTGYAGYPPRLQSKLRQKYGSQINVFCQQDKSWFPGGHAYTGDEKINKAMEYHGPHHVLILFGTIDIVDPGASGCEDYDCHTIEHLENIILKVRQYQAIPYLSTLTPVNPESERADLQDSIEELNVNIRILANSMGVVLCDLEEAFYSAPLPLEDYFAYDEEEEEVDWAHFNDVGYRLIAETWDEIL